MSPQADRGRNAREQLEIDRTMAKWTRWVAVFTGISVVVASLSNLFIYLQYSTAAQVQLETREQSKAVVSLSATALVVPQDLTQPGAVLTVVPTFQNFGTTRTSFLEPKPT